jgi:hypothetical protein
MPDDSRPIITHYNAILTVIIQYYRIVFTNNLVQRLSFNPGTLMFISNIESAS